MLQRTPTYVASLPAEDPFAQALRRLLPDRATYPIVRWKNVLLQTAFYRLCRRFPNLMRRFIRRRVSRSLPPGYPVETHFDPPYDPWDQRLCLVPDSDLFKVISSGRAELVTDGIDSFTAGGIRLRSGRVLEADVIVTATGLNLLFLGGIEVVVDGEPLDTPRSMIYRGMMLDGVPNLAFAVGYTNASWTLKVDLVSEYVCRLLAHMDATGTSTCVPELTDPSVVEEPLLDFTAGYVLRSLDQLPKQGSKLPWHLRQNYPLDLVELRHGGVEDGTMRFSGPVPQAEQAEKLAA
jgi:cation diffusion facilitator CzcD-associated flavoprotein CzcO